MRAWVGMLQTGLKRLTLRSCILILCVACAAGGASAQRARASVSEDEFGPVVRAYLGYLRAQQEVVDDRASRHEVSRAYYIRNSNRIRALRQMAVRIARETENDYLPELEAVAADELDTLFDTPPKMASVRVDEVLNYTFRYLGTVRSGRERFHVFARLDPFEQAELKKKAEAEKARGEHSSAHEPSAEPATSRPRRVNTP